MKFESGKDTEGNVAGPEARRAFTIAIVYDDSAAGARAMGLYNRVLQQFRNEFDFHCGVWCFDVLEVPEVLNAAVRAGKDADLIVVSARHDCRLPDEVRDWLDLSVAEKFPGSSALVGLFEPSRVANVSYAATRNFLQKAAARAGIAYFSGEFIPAASKSKSPANDEQGASGTVSPLLEKLIQPSAAPKIIRSKKS